MKKLALAFSALLIVLVSCSVSEEDLPTNQVDPSQVLLKKRIIIESGHTYTTNISYDGNKILGSTSDNGTSTVFTYSGNLISGIEYFLGADLKQREIYSYDSSGKLLTYISLSYDTPTNGNGVKETFVYNTDGTISYSGYSGDLISQTNLINTYKAFYTNGEITKVEKYTGTSTSVVNYNYDDKNNPFKNVVGYGAISFINSNPNGFFHNVLMKTYISSPSSNVTYSYTYNSNNYPVTLSKTDNSNTVYTQYFYE